MTITRNSLKNFLSLQGELISSLGISLKFTDEYMDGSYSVQLDSTKYIGGVCYWPENVFEFQFLSLPSGDEVLLETKEFEEESELASYFTALLSKFYAI